MEPTPPLIFGSFRLDPQQRKLWRGDQPVDLQPKPLAVLQYLIEHPNRVVTKEELLKQVWAGVYVTKTALRVCIHAIREALGEEVDAPHYLETVGREGYRFIAPSGSPQPVVSNQLSVVSKNKEPATAPSLGTGNWQLTTHLVGRATELAQLHQLLDAALHGERQIVFVTGDPGVGKTTVVDLFLEQVQATGRARIGRGQCLEQYGGGEAYLPLLEALGQLCRGPGGDWVIQVLSQYAPTWLVQMPALVAEAELEGLQRKVAGTTRERMLREMAEALEALTAEQGGVVVFEDLHWSDRATVELLAYLAQRRAQVKLLVLGTYRPIDVVLKGHPLKGIKQEMDAHRQCREVPLELLTQAEVAEYIAKRFPATPATTEVARVIHRRTDGNALFMVNVTDYCLHHNLIVQEGGEWRLKRNLEESGVPTSLQQMVVKQLEGVTEEERRLLEVASVVGMEFTAAVVAAALESDTDTVEEVCEALAYRGQFLREQGITERPDGTVSGRYAFRHVLYQNVLYERIAVARRVRLHRIIGDHEERGQGERAKEIAAELAMHFERGRDSRRAVQYLQQAGENAVRRSAYHEAINHWEKGVSLLQTWPDTPERAQQELRLQAALGPALMFTQGYTSLEAEKTYTRARELCQQLGETPELFSVRFGLWRFYNGRAESQPARELGEQMLRAAQSVQDSILLLGAHYTLGTTTFHCGEIDLSRMHLEQVEMLYSPSRHDSSVLLYGNDLGVTCKSYVALALWFFGYPNQAVGKAQEAIALAQSLSHPFSLASALFFALLLHQHRREEHIVQEQSAELIALCQKYGFRHWLANGMVMQGWALTEQGQIEQIAQGIATLRAMGSRVGLTMQLGLLADVYRKGGRLEEALKAVEEGLTIVQDAGEQVWGAELYRLKGELTLQQSKTSPGPVTSESKTSRKKLPVVSSQLLVPNPQAEAEACLLKAIEVARQQQAKSLELRATVSLARLWRCQDKNEEAHQMLADVYGWFTEGFDTKDLQEAKALLEELHH